MKSISYITDIQRDANPDPELVTFAQQVDFDFKELVWTMYDNWPAGIGDALTTDPLSQFAATTLAELNVVISDATLGDAGDFATSAEGLLAASATQPGDNVSDLVNDAGYVTSAGGSTATKIYDSAAVDLTDFHNDPNLSTDIPFIAAGDGVWMSKSGAEFTALQDIPLLELVCTVATTDSSVNNRSIYRLDINHRDAGDVDVKIYKGTSIFIRDDTAVYDAGSMQITVPVRGILTGHKITVSILTMDSQTGGGSVAPVDTNESELLMTVVS